MSKKEEFAEIFDVLKSVAEHRHQPILESELRDITKRVYEYRKGPELHRLILAISTERYFPSGHELEQQVRAAKGLPPLKGLTADLIDKNEEELIVSGQSVKNAKAGAEMIRKTLRKPALEDKTQDDVDEASASIALSAIVERQEAVTKELYGFMEFAAEKANQALEDFDEPTTNLMAELDEF